MPNQSPSKKSAKKKVLLKKPSKYYVYLLECADKSIYTGITTDVKRRLIEHQHKTGARYTSAHGAQKMLYTERFPGRSQALVREAEIKKWKRSKKLALIASAPYTTL